MLGLPFKGNDDKPEEPTKGKRKKSTGDKHRRKSAASRKSTGRASLRRSASVHSTHSRTSVGSHHSTHHHRHSRHHSVHGATYKSKVLKRLRDFEDETDTKLPDVDLTRLSLDLAEAAMQSSKKGSCIQRTLQDWCGLFAIIELVYGVLLLAAKIIVMLKGKQGQIDIVIKAYSKDPLPLIDYIETGIAGLMILSAITLFAGASQVANFFNVLHTLLAFLCALLIITDAGFVHFYSAYWWLTWLHQLVRGCWVFVLILFALASLLLYKRIAFETEQSQRPVPESLRILNLLHPSQHHH